MGLLVDFISFLSFLSGTVFGILIAVVAALHLLNSPDSYLQDIKAKHDEELKNLRAEDAVHAGDMGKAEKDELNRIIDYLDDVNAPLKNISGVLQRIHMNKEQDAATLETKMKTIVDYNTLVRMEKEFQDSVAELKDHSKSLKTLSSFLNEMGKAFNSSARDMTKIANSARSNMNKSVSFEKKEDLIVNNWWQTLQVALDHMASDQEDLATLITVELINFSGQIQEEISIIEKRLTAEGTRQFSAMKENIQLFEMRLRDREKIKEKNRTVPITATGSEKEKEKLKRETKYKAVEDNLIVQTKKLYEVQKEFYTMIPRISSDVQLTILKSIVETQSQLFKLSEGMDRVQQRHSHVTKRMRAQLNNAAASLVQMIREECKLIPDDAPGSVGGSSIALDALRQRMSEIGVQGYEISLQKVLEGLLAQAQLRDVSTSSGPSDAYASPARSSSPLPDSASNAPGVPKGKLDMFNEATACLAACNPTLLPMLPRTFNGAIGMETCVWFNAFTGRVYRDIASSKYFYHWFCSKMTNILNKNEKERPAYIDRFQVLDVKFGDLPPLLCNVKWSPPVARQRGQGTARQQKRGHQPGEAGAEEDSSDSEDESSPKLTTEDIEGRARDFPETEEETLFYAACTADLAFRSGIKFTIATKFFLNWPRDRYVSVPVLLHFHISEVAGRIRFGCTRAYSFLTFLHKPLLRISVRSEVGNDKYKLRDIPQVSEFIERKLKNFVNRKIVYPHSHKFRLIWPRNWWPEGTENLFMPQGGVPEGEGVHPIFAQPTPPTTAQPSVPTPASTSTSAKEEEGRARTRSGDGSRSAKFSSFFKTSSSSTSSQNAPAAATTATAPPTATAPSGVTGVPAAATVVSVASPGTIPSLPTATVLATSQPSNASQSAPTVPRERSRTASTPPVPVPVAVEHHVRRRSSSTTSATAEERWMEFLWKERRRIPEDPKMHGPPDMRACTVLPQFYADFDGEDQYSFGRSASFDLSTQSTAPPLRRVRSVGDFRHTSAAVGWRHFVDHHLEALDARFAVHPGTTDHDAVQEDARAAQQLNGDWLASADGHRVSGEGAQRRGSRRGSERDTNSHREEMRALLERGKASMQTARAKLSAFKQRHLGGHQIKDFLFTDESSTSSRSQHGQSSPTPRPTAAPTPASPSVNDSSNQPQTAARPRPSLNSASSAKRPSLTGTDTAEGGSASSAMKYVASIFRSTGGGAGDNNDSERRRSVLRPPTGAEDESGSVAGGGGEGKTRMKDMLSKAFSSVR